MHQKAQIERISTLHMKKTKQTKITQTAPNRTKWEPTMTDLANKIQIQHKIRTLNTKKYRELKLVPKLLSLYVDDQFSHGNETKNGLKYDHSKNTLTMSTVQNEIDGKREGDEKSIELLSNY